MTQPKKSFFSLTVLKTTESSFTNFIRDEFTTLVEVDDRIFSTSIDLNYTFAPIHIQSPTDEKKLDFIIPLQKGEKGYEGSVWDDKVPERARLATLDIFATDDSASVQVWFYSSFFSDVMILLSNSLVGFLYIGYPVQNGTTCCIRKCVHTDGVLLVA